MFVITQREATDSGCIYDLDRRVREQTEEERSRERVERNRELRSNTEKWSTQELLSETLSSINLLSLLQKFWTLCPDKIQYKDARICFCGGTLEMKLLPSCFISSFIFINRPYKIIAVTTFLCYSVDHLRWGWRPPTKLHEPTSGCHHSDVIQRFNGITRTTLFF